jgi:hypothetical protein
MNATTMTLTEKCQRVQDIFLPMSLGISAHRLGFREGGAPRRPDI